MRLLIHHRIARLPESDPVKETQDPQPRRALIPFERKMLGLDLTQL
jgi:hypothetical protein